MVDSVDVIGDAAEHGLIGVCVEDGVGCAGVAVAWLADTTGIDDESVVDGRGILDVGVAKDEPGVVVEIRAEFWELAWIDILVSVLGMRVDEQVFAVGDSCCFGKVLEPLTLCFRERLLGVFEASMRHVVEPVLVGRLDGPVVVALHSRQRDTLNPSDALAGHRIGRCRPGYVARSWSTTRSRH